MDLQNSGPQDSKLALPWCWWVPANYICHHYIAVSSVWYLGLTQLTSDTHGARSSLFQLVRRFVSSHLPDTEIWAVAAHLPLINSRYDLIDWQWTFYSHFSSSAVSAGPSLQSSFAESYRATLSLNVTMGRQPDISMIRWEKERFVIIKFSTI